MGLLLLVAAVVLWLTLDRKTLHNRSQWASVAASLIGLILMAKGRVIIGVLLIGGAALWSRWPRQRKAESSEPFNESLARAEACDLLGIPADADRDTIVAAHRRLIARNHPDSGGTAGLAARLNAARDLLLKHRSP